MWPPGWGTKLPTRRWWVQTLARSWCCILGKDTSPIISWGKHLISTDFWPLCLPFSSRFEYQNLVYIPQGPCLQHSLLECGFFANVKSWPRICHMVWSQIPAWCTGLCCPLVAVIRTTLCQRCHGVINCRVTVSRPIVFTLPNVLHVFFWPWISLWCHETWWHHSNYLENIQKISYHLD